MNRTYRHHPSPALEDAVNTAFGAMFEVWERVVIAGESDLPRGLVEDLLQAASVLQVITSELSWANVERAAGRAAVRPDAIGSASIDEQSGIGGGT